MFEQVLPVHDRNAQIFLCKYIQSRGWVDGNYEMI